jgi:hypothetical protein
MNSPYNLQTNSGKYKDVRYFGNTGSTEISNIPVNGGIPLKKLICDIFLADEHNVFANGKNREQATVRQVYISIMLKNTFYSQSKIGEMAQGTRDKPLNHATVKHAKTAIENLIDTDKVFRDKYERLEIAIKNNKINFDR